MQIFLCAEGGAALGAVDTFAYLLYMCLVRVRECVHARVDVEIRGRLAGIGSLLPIGTGG